MAGKGCYVPATKVGPDYWYLLSPRFGSKHVFRYISSGKEKNVPEPSGHRVREMTVEGSVKWRPKDSSKLIITDIPPLGAS